jgi:hypothetical protein
MLTEIEDRIIKVLQQSLEQLPPENITAKSASGKLPSLTISNLKFKFMNAGVAENLEQEKTKLTEYFSGNASTKVYKLKETPLRRSVTAKSPPEKVLAEKDQYVVNYEGGSVIFLEAPDKGKNNILIEYTSRKSIMTLKTIRLKALYQIEVAGKERSETDALAESVVKALLNAESEFLSNGIEIKPVSGIQLSEQEKVGSIQLKYIFERELRTETTVEPMEQIQISQKPRKIS